MRSLVILTWVMMCSLPAHAQEKILILPFDYVEMSPVDGLERQLARELREASLDVLEPDQVSREQGLDLVNQRSRCSDDLLCLVQVGELLEATRLVVAKVKRGRTQTDNLTINVIDVARASLVDSIRWDIRFGEENLRQATLAGAKQLLIPPDTLAVFEIEPPESTVYLYGRTLREIRSGEAVPYWSGVYLLRVEHPGYETREARVTLETGKTSRVRFQLELDPLYIQPTAPLTRSELVRSKQRKTLHRKTALTNPWVWISVSAGALAMIGGGAYMFMQQEQYNELAGETRDFTNANMITGARDADLQRQKLQENYEVGSISFMSGAALAGAAFSWMLLDVAWGGPE